MTRAKLPAGWRSGDEFTNLDDGALHVWLANLDDLAAVGAHLPDAERARAARFTDELQRRRWMGVRGVLRSLLGRYLERDPRSLRFGAAEHGKPFLLSPDRQDAVHFNLSHSGALALFAVSRDAEVGIDVERSARPIDAAALATARFGAAEGARLSTLAPARARQLFLEAWVVREAQVKCLGIGLGASGQASTAAIWTGRLELGARAVAAVAASSRPSRIDRWIWSTREASVDVCLGGR
jgi:4'-phosphopantetheinyl transferase